MILSFSHSKSQPNWFFLKLAHSVDQVVQIFPYLFKNYFSYYSYVCYDSTYSPLIVALIFPLFVTSTDNHVHVKSSSFFLSHEEVWKICLLHYVSPG